MLTQRGGGWPLTMFLTHDEQRPFFGGTYFPKEARYGLPAFKDILLRVAAYYREHAGELRRRTTRCWRRSPSSIRRRPAPTASSPPRRSQPAARSSRAASIRSNGGFGGAPKFPHPQTIAWLLRCWHAERAHRPSPTCRRCYMATLTLRRMAEGGINDQLGGGFCRYAVDEYWMIPHFEKMLYDNGALLAVYAQAALASGDALYARVAQETAGWVLREMQSRAGRLLLEPRCRLGGPRGQVLRLGSRGGARRAQQRGISRCLRRASGSTKPPNFEGRWHLRVAVPSEEIASRLGRTPQAGESAHRQRACAKLLDDPRAARAPGAR